MVYNKNRKISSHRPNRKQIGAKFAEPDFGSDSDLNFEFEKPEIPIEEEKSDPPLKNIKNTENVPKGKNKNR